MNVSEMDDIDAVVASAEEAPNPDECGQCGVPVDPLQRYCVNCGAHRHHVPDPAARYLAQASARARAGGPPARQQAGRRRSSRSPLTAVVLAAVLAGGGVAVGAAIERGPANNDAQVVRALHRLEAGGVTGHNGAPGSSTSNRTAGHSGDATPRTSAATRLQHATGKNYVKQAQQLPNSVAVP